VPQGQVELVLRQGRKAQAQVSPLQEQQALRSEVLSERAAQMLEPEAQVQPVLHGV
jgi:hypothetical protein